MHNTMVPMNSPTYSERKDLLSEFNMSFSIIPAVWPVAHETSVVYWMVRCFREAILRQPRNRGELVAFPLAGRLVVESSLTGHSRKFVERYRRKWTTEIILGQQKTRRPPNTWAWAGGPFIKREIPSNWCIVSKKFLSSNHVPDHLLGTTGARFLVVTSFLDVRWFPREQEQIGYIPM